MVDKIANPFRMPSDEEVFAIRDDERRRREEERKHQLSLPAQEKGTWGSKAFASTGAFPFRICTTIRPKAA